VLTTIYERISGRLTRGGPRREGAGKPEDLLRLAAELENLNRATERDFLGVGARLDEVRTAARRIASDMAALSEAIAGAGGERAWRALTRMLEHCQAMDRRLEESGRALGSLRELAAGLRQTFSGRGNTVSVFRSLCTLIRIETSRLGATGVDFGNLAEEVQPLSEKIQASGEGVMRTAGELDAGARAALSQGAALRAKELEDLKSLGAGVQGSLEEFEGRRRAAGQASREQALQYASVSEAIDNLVESIQFHDITRQQVEHVAQALRALGREGEAGRREAAGAPDRRVIFALQASQLAESKRLFGSSVERIEAALGSIGERLAGMSAASRALTGVSANEQESFLARMETSFGSMLEAAGACQAAQQQMARVAREFRERVGRMRDAVSDIRGTELQIERIAINATLRAIQIGDAGNALDIVAGVMLRLAQDSSQNTDQVGQGLDAMLEAVAGMLEEGSVAEGPEESGGAIFVETRAAIGDLHAASAASLARVHEIALLGGRLVETMGAAGREFSAGRLFSQTVEKVRAELAALGAGGEPAWGEAGAVTAGHLERFAQTYSMQSQRDVHQNVMSGAAGAPGDRGEEAPAGGRELKGGELGDNVELF